MKVINLGEKSSVINTYMAQLRDVNVQGNRTLFRRNLQRIARATAYEVSHTLSYSEKEFTTPLGTKLVPTYDDRIVVGTVLRARLTVGTLSGCTSISPREMSISSSSCNVTLCGGKAQSRSPS